MSSPSDTVMWMCASRFLIGYAVPRARGWMRFMIGPPSIRASLTNSSSRSRAPLSSALPRALLSTCSTSRAPRVGMKRSSSSASSALRPRISCTVGRILRGATSAYRCVALYSIAVYPLLGRGLLPAGVPLEQPGRRELAELVTDHVFRHVQLHEDAAVVDQERLLDEVRQDRAVARPRLDRLAVAGLLRLLDLGQKPLVVVRPLLRGPAHA